jgi:hypothetical protein
LALPAKGEVVVTHSDRGFTVRANEAHRMKIAKGLGEAGSFTVVARGLQKAAPVTYTVADASAEAIVADLFQGVPYAFFYKPGPDGGANALDRVLVGMAVGLRPHGKAAPEGGLANRGRRAGGKRGEGSARAAMTPEERQARLDAQRKQHEEALASLSDADETVRADAVADLDTDQIEDMEKLRGLLASDPSPLVRKAAADQLSSASGPAAAEALVQALGDPDPEVVIQTIDSLEYVGDASLASKLEPLRSHPDPRVREKADEALHFLQ